MKRKTSKTRPGFTLIELLIAIGIFAIVVSIAVGGVARMLRTERQVLALIAANSNAGLVIEQMSREIRTGSDFFVGNGTTGDTLSFTNANGDAISYALSADNVITRTVNGTAQGITATNVYIQYLTFVLLENPTVNYPPRITIALGVSPTPVNGITLTVTKLETTVSARLF